MIQINKGIVPLTILAPDQEVPQEIIDSGNPGIFMQGENYFTLKPNPFFTTLQKSKTDGSKYFKDCIYDEETVYVLKNQLKDFVFPTDVFQYAMKYMQWIYDTYKAEGALLLLAHPEKKEWKLQTVIQIESHGSAVTYIQPILSSENLDSRDKYRMDAILKDDGMRATQEAVVENFNKEYDDGWRIFGTIHSHCNFSAFHSGVDDHDEINFNGLHITIGNVRSGWSYAARYMIEGQDVTLKIENILGVESMDEIENGVDSIELEALDKNLIVKLPQPPQPKKNNFFQHGIYQSQRKAMPINRERYQPEFFNWDDDQKDDYEGPYVDEYGKLVNDEMEAWYGGRDLYADSVWEDDEILILEHFVSGNQIFVTYDYYQYAGEIFRDYEIVNFETEEEVEEEDEEYTYQSDNEEDETTEAGVKTSNCVLINTDVLRPTAEGQYNWGFAKLNARKAKKLV